MRPQPRIRRHRHRVADRLQQRQVIRRIRVEPAPPHRLQGVPPRGQPALHMIDLVGAVTRFAVDLARPVTADELARVIEPMRQRVTRASTSAAFWSSRMNT